MESISIRVLLADDEAAIRNGLQNAIPWEQYHAKVVAIASNGQEALDLIRSYLPDLVIIDIKIRGLRILQSPLFVFKISHNLSYTCLKVEYPVFSKKCIYAIVLFNYRYNASYSDTMT